MNKLNHNKRKAFLNLTNKSQDKHSLKKECTQSITETQLIIKILKNRFKLKFHKK